MKKWIIGISSGVVVILISALIIIQISLTKPNRENNEINSLADEKAGIVTIDKNYHMSRAVVSNSLVGKDKKGDLKYFIYLPKEKKAYVFNEEDGVDEQTIRSNFEKKYPTNKIFKINLGWYNNQAVWEISFRNKNNHLGYIINQFSDGSELSYIDNL